jgi:hypothetical protein
MLTIEESGRRFFCSEKTRRPNWKLLTKMQRLIYPIFPDPGPFPYSILKRPDAAALQDSELRFQMSPL